jgi:hypothetical protein
LTSSAVAANADVIAEEGTKFNESYTVIIIVALACSLAFAVCGCAIRKHCTIAKKRTDRGVITSMLLPEDEVL